MRVAVLSLTRDRLWSTRHCFGVLRTLAGCGFDHYVYDQHSQDGTRAWLEDEYRPHFLWCNAQNVGISLALNFLLDRLDGEYDMVVKFDNDCELTVPGTLKAACEAVMADPGWLLSPHIQGLNSPPGVGAETTVAGFRVGEIGLIGGIFLAAPGSLYQRDGYRHDPANPVWGMDDANLGAHWRGNGGRLGYLLDYPANHFLTTQGQQAQDPDYFARKMAEYTG